MKSNLILKHGSLESLICNKELTLLIKNSSDVGMELRSKLQEKSKQYEDMEHAFIIVV